MDTACVKLRFSDGSMIAIDTIYNYVYPNNHRMIEFLRKGGYTVLNSNES